MENLQKLFQNFFENRFDEEVKHLRETNPEYKGYYCSFKRTWDDLSSTLEPYQMDKLQNLIAIHNAMNCSDIESAYLNGCKDIMQKLKEFSNQKKKA